MSGTNCPLECVPNFSEGRRPEVVDALCGVIGTVRGVRLLHRTMDAVHNRAVLTLAGEPEPLIVAMLAAAGVARKLIDLNYHRGVHPRIGALDVCPFVPLSATPMALAIETAKTFAQRLGDELQIPVFLYEAAAERPERRNLAALRVGQFEGLRQRVGVDPAWDPDRGPRRVHPTAGATAVGARFFLVAFNVELASGDLALAKAIASQVRERDGGLPQVKALGMRLAADLVQVSMNLVDYRVTGVRQAFQAVQRAAQAHGVAVKGSELIGLVPQQALDAATARAVMLRDFDPTRHWLEAALARP